MSRILIADHHPITRKGLKAIITDNPDYEIIGSVQDGEELLPQIATSQVDLLILEIDLPNLSGITALKEIKKEFPRLRILVLSCHPEEMYALSAIKSGASGYVDKTASLETIKKAIQQVHRGGIYLNKDLTERLSASQTYNQNLVYKYKKLSSREIEVLNLLSNGHRNKDIAMTLDINEKTVSTYKTRLLKKLNVTSLADLIKQARLLQTSDL
ncbi:response regulator [Croceiramulus getboli]|nr:response regulator transcription factor [Flavobacteriaceae bacterium YJPT1-3]